MQYLMNNELVEAIEAERQKQIEQWGGGENAEHDDAHEPAEWRRFREKFENRITKRSTGTFGLLDLPQPHPVQKDALIKIIALAVAQYESVERQELEMGG